MAQTQAFTILMADDDPEDRMLMREALDELGGKARLHFAVDGEDLLDYLGRRGNHEDMKGQPLPGLILLDLNMPRMDGREALAILKSHERWRRIPIVVLTTSKSQADILSTYDLGVNSFITKPVSFNALVELLNTLSHYWFDVVELPNPGTEIDDEDH